MFFQQKLTFKQYVQRLIRAAALLAFFCGGCGSDNPTSPNEDSSARAQARQYVQWFYENQLNQLWDHFAENLKMVYPDINTLAAYRADFLNSLGKETGIVTERVLTVDQMRLYERAATFEKSSIPVMLQWILDASESYDIAFIEVRPLPPEASSDFLNYRTKTELHLPFEGEWFVLRGGRSIEDNYHADTPNQRFADDFMVLANGTYFVGDGRRNEDYFCFGKPVLAPGAGLVIASENTVCDNTPPEQNLGQLLGNYVMIDHGNGEYSFLGHLKHGSVTVKAGNRVSAGQFLGLCGNSGGSDLPHLHYHLQNTPNPLDIMGAQGLPAQFQSYRANGKNVSRGEPVHGQKVQNM